MENGIEELYRSLVEHSSDGIFFAEESGCLTDANPAGCQLLGYSREELLGRTISDVAVVGPESPLRLDDLQEGRALLRKRELIRKDGSRVPAEISGIRLAGGGFLGIVRDITQRRRAEEILRESEERHRLISSLTTDYFFHLTVAGDGSVVMDQISDAYGPATGRTLRETATPETWARIIHPEDFPALLELLGRLVAEGGDEDFECRSFVHSGQQRWVHVVARAIRPPEIGRTTAIIGAVKDITDRKRAELALRENQRELSTWHDLVTHDLANFSMTLLGLVEQLLDETDEPLSAARREALRRVYRQGFEMHRLAENAKLLAKLRDGPVAEPVADCEIAASIEEAVRSVRAVHFDRRIEISVDCPPDLRVRGIPFLVNVFLNLLDNAVRHHGKGATEGVEIRARRTSTNPSRIETLVRGGYPPPDELIPTLFDRYVKGPHSSGTGLGLAAVRGLVDLAGGSVRARAARDGGDPVFEIVLDLPSA